MKSHEAQWKEKHSLSYFHVGAYAILSQRWRTYQYLVRVFFINLAYLHYCIRFRIKQCGLYTGCSRENGTLRFIVKLKISAMAKDLNIN